MKKETIKGCLLTICMLNLRPALITSLAVDTSEVNWKKEEKRKKKGHTFIKAISSRRDALAKLIGISHCITI